MSTIDDQLDPIIDAHLRHLEGEGPAPDLSALPAPVQDEARARIALLEAAWGTQLEPPVPDPVAQRFGFDRAGQDLAIDGRRVASLRNAAHIDLAELLDRVITAGGSINAAALFKLEQDPVAIVSQPTASALVAALGTELDPIEATGDIDLGAVRAFLDSPACYDLIESWAAEHHRERDEVNAVVTERVLAAHFRAEDVTVEQLTVIVQTILDSLDP